MRDQIIEYLNNHGIWSWWVLDFWLMFTLALLSGTLLTLYLWRREGRPLRIAADLLFWGILGLFVGMKFLYYLQFGFPWRMIDWVGTPGMSLYGGLLGLLAAWSFLYLLKPYPLLSFLDCTAPALALGVFFGRIGCFLAGCNGGITSTLPWGVHFPRGSATFANYFEAGRVDRLDEFTPLVHPTQLYEALFGLLCFSLLLFLFRRRQWDGQVFLSGIIWYSIYRFGTEPLRIDNTGVEPFGIFTFAQFVSLLLGLAALILFAVLARRTSTDRQASPVAAGL